MDLITLALAKKGSGGNSSSSGRTTLVSFTREGQSLDSPIKLATPATYQELLDSIERHDEIFVVSSFGSRSFNSKPIDICVDTERNFIILNYINKIDNTEYKCTATIASDGQIWYESKMAPGIKYLRFIDGSTLNIQDPENNWSDVRASAMKTWINGGYTLILIDSEHQYSVSGTYKYGGDIYGVYFSGIYDERVSSNLINHYIRTIFVSDSNITKTDIPIPASTELTPATATELGGIKVGDGLSIDSNGVLNSAFIKTEKPADTVNYISINKKGIINELRLKGFTGRGNHLNSYYPENLLANSKTPYLLNDIDNIYISKLDNYGPNNRTTLFNVNYNNPTDISTIVCDEKLPSPKSFGKETVAVSACAKLLSGTSFGSIYIKILDEDNNIITMIPFHTARVENYQIAVGQVAAKYFSNKPVYFTIQQQSGIQNTIQFFNLTYGMGAYYNTDASIDNHYGSFQPMLSYKLASGDSFNVYRTNEETHFLQLENEKIKYFPAAATNNLHYGANELKGINISNPYEYKEDDIYDEIIVKGKKITTIYRTDIYRFNDVGLRGMMHPELENTVLLYISVKNGTTTDNIMCNLYPNTDDSSVDKRIYCSNNNIYIHDSSISSTADAETAFENLEVIFPIPTEVEVTSELPSTKIFNSLLCTNGSVVLSLDAFTGSFIDSIV